MYLRCLQELFKHTAISEKLCITDISDRSFEFFVYNNSLKAFSLTRVATQLPAIYFVAIVCHTRTEPFKMNVTG